MSFFHPNGLDRNPGRTGLTGNLGRGSSEFSRDEINIPVAIVETNGIE